ncbi:hypothetical protein Tco_0250657 [Tanacetum coccineum]
MDDDLEDETDDDMGYNPSDVAFIEWLRSKIFNYKTMDQYTMKALWIYWIRGDDETMMTTIMMDQFDGNMDVPWVDYKNDWIYEWNKDVPWVDEKPWTDTGKEDGYCNGGNLPGTYIIENQLPYQDYEWYEALDDCELKEEALRNKAIMDGVINNDESCYELKRKWNIYTNYDDAYEINHEDNGNKELCKIHKPPYVAIKEDEYDDLIMTRRDACEAYQEIFRIMDEGWMDLVKEISTNISGEFTKSGDLEVLES